MLIDMFGILLNVYLSDSSCFVVILISFHW